MTEWRALTQGGVLSGSQVFNGPSNYSRQTYTFTCPERVTRVKVVNGDTNGSTWKTEYFNVTPGTSYKIVCNCDIGIDSWQPGWSFNNEEVGDAHTNTDNGYNPRLTVYWSNSINQGGS